MKYLVAFLLILFSVPCLAVEKQKPVEINLPPGDYTLVISVGQEVNVPNENGLSINIKDLPFKITYDGEPDAQED